MAGRDNFGSDMKSPGGWGGSGGNGMSGGPGGAKSSSNYNYQVTPSKTGGPVKIGNYNTGGATVGFGNQYGVNGLGENNMGKGPWPGGYSQPVLTSPVPPPATPPVDPPTVSPVVAALAARLQGFQANPFQRYNTPPSSTPSAPVMSKYGPRVQGVPPGQYGANNPASGFGLANFNSQGTWGGGQQTTINKSPGGGGYTNINKNGGGYGYSSYGGPR